MEPISWHFYPCVQRAIPKLHALQATFEFSGDFQRWLVLSKDSYRRGAVFDRLLCSRADIQYNLDQERLLTYLFPFIEVCRLEAAKCHIPPRRKFDRLTLAQLS
jgi:hypothetical protein